MFNEVIQNSFTLTFDSWTSYRRTANTGLNYQLDEGSSFDFNSPKHLVAVHRTDARTGVPNKANKISSFDDLDVRTYFVEINGERYPNHAIGLDYTKTQSI